MPHSFLPPPPILPFPSPSPFQSLCLLPQWCFRTYVHPFVPAFSIFLSVFTSLPTCCVPAPPASRVKVYHPYSRSFVFAYFSAKVHSLPLVVYAIVNNVLHYLQLHLGIFIVPVLHCTRPYRTRTFPVFHSEIALSYPLPSASLESV